MEQHISHQREERTRTWIMSGAIIVAALIVGASILYSGTIFKPIQNEVETQKTAPSVSDKTNILKVRSDDYVWGNASAPVTLFVYSDTECPFCKQYHTTLQELMKTYGTNGSVAIVFRHFPLDNLHSKARTEAQAIECAGKLGGSQAFWGYLDRIFSVTPSNNGLDLAELPRIATYIGLNEQKFNTCLSQNGDAKKIQTQQSEGSSLGVRGTPFTFILSKKGTITTVNGAQSVTSVSAMIDSALQEK